MPLDTELLRDFAQWTKEKRNAEAIVKDRTRRLAEIDEPIRLMFAEEGVPSCPVTVPARDVDAEAVSAISSCFEPLTEATRHLIPSIVNELRFRGLLVESSPKFTMNLSVGSRIWAKPFAADGERATEEEHEAACRALRDKGFGDFVHERFNVISLSSAVKEDVENGVIPIGSDFFDGKVVVEEKFQVKATERKEKK